MKRERISPEKYLKEIKTEIFQIKNNPESISSKGPTKGQMKSVEKKRIENLEGRTIETSRFYELYEKTRKERNLVDYDDILEYIVELVQRSSNIRDTIRERYLYVLVDEHQDSNKVQNEFLSAVWADWERPNVFVVGDDRQLIYGFGGASLSHFENFLETFRGTKLITLTKNYRSTQNILDLAGMFLKSMLVTEPLECKERGAHPIRLIEAEYPRDEILVAGLEIKERIETGTAPKEAGIER